MDRFSRMLEDAGTLEGLLKRLLSVTELGNLKVCVCCLPGSVSAGMRSPEPKRVQGNLVPSD